MFTGAGVAQPGTRSPKPHRRGRVHSVGMLKIWSGRFSQSAGKSKSPSAR